MSSRAAADMAVALEPPGIASVMQDGWAPLATQLTAVHGGATAR